MSLTPFCLGPDATDQLEQKVNEFFVNAKKNKPEWREEQMEVIKKVQGAIDGESKSLLPETGIKPDSQ